MKIVSQSRRNLPSVASSRVVFAGELCAAQACSQNAIEYFIGLDEVGRGCLAGPVVTAASLWVAEKGYQATWVQNIRDSKKLSAKARQSLYEVATKTFPHLMLWNPLADAHPATLNCHHGDLTPSTQPMQKLAQESAFQRVPNSFSLRCLDVQLGSASAYEIDSYNIWQAVQLAMGRALKKLHPVAHAEGVNLEQNCALLIDGNKGICVPKSFRNCPQITCVGGDDLLVTIGFSSVVAKVARDSYMEICGGPADPYGLAQHKGYATKAHIGALQKIGPSTWHRISFLGNILPTDTPTHFDTLFSEPSLKDGF